MLFVTRKFLWLVISFREYLFWERRETWQWQTFRVCWFFVFRSQQLELIYRCEKFWLFAV